ncbi:MAG TPA: hypothetical protein VF143_12140, partial [Candidatus Nanopelagicales bacterium]
DPGGFAAAYRILSAMEERGRVQRVYAVDGLGGAQFALPGVVDQLREVERELAEGRAETLVLAACDPANAYGAALDWPASDWAGSGENPHRPGRAAGSTVVLHGGRLVLYVERGGRSMLTFPVAEAGRDATSDEVLTTAASALHAAVRAGVVGQLVVTRINGVPALEPQGQHEPVRDALVSAGFSQTPRGYRARP